MSDIRMSPEMRLLVAAARHGTGDPDAAAVRHAVASIENWALLEEMADAHRLVPFVAEALSVASELVPADTMRGFVERRLAIAERSQRALDESGRLQERLTAAGVPSLIYKGPLLAHRAYGSASMRECLDIDLVVNESDVERAAAVLAAEGFVVRDGLSLRTARVVNAVFGQIPFEPTADPDAFDVDLHWRFCNPTLPWSPPLAQVLARCAPVSLNGRSYAAPDATEELLLQLLHVARHQWRSLEWLLLVRALMRDPSVDGAALLRAAQDGVRGRRAVLIGCEVARLMLGGTPPKEVAAEIARDEDVQRFAAEIARTVLGRDRLGARDRGWVLRALDSRRDRLTLLVGEAAIPTPREAEVVVLPEALAPLYWPLRWIRLLARTIGIGRR